MKMRACAHCNEPFALATCAPKYCSQKCIGIVQQQQRCAQYAVRRGGCGFTPAVRFMVCVTPLHDAKRKFCSNRCRRVDFRRRHTHEAPLDAGEILVRDLEESPRRLRLARFVTGSKAAGFSIKACCARRGSVRPGRADKIVVRARGYA